MRDTAERVFLKNINAIIKGLDEGLYGYKKAMKDVRNARDRYVDNLDRMERK